MRREVIQKYLVEAFDMKDSSYPGLELCTSELGFSPGSVEGSFEWLRPRRSGECMSLDLTHHGDDIRQYLDR